MNSSTQSMTLDSKDSANEVIRLLYEIDNNLYSIKDKGFDTNEVYKTFDLLRYEILSDKNVERLVREGQIEEVIRKLHIYNDLISDLTSEFAGVEQELRAIKKDNNYKNSKINDKKSDAEYVKNEKLNKGMISAILLSTAIFLTPLVSLAGYGISSYKKNKNSPQVISYSINSEGNKSQKIRYSKEYNDVVVLYDYSEKDDAGCRTRKEYQLHDFDFDDNIDIDKIDLSGMPYEMEVVKSDDSIKTDGEYREVLYEVQNKDVFGEDESFNMGVYTTNLAMAAIVTIVFELILNGLTYDISCLRCGGIFLAELISIKKSLYILKKQMDKNTEKAKNYEKTINTLINRIDKVIKKASEEITNAEIVNEIRKEKEVKIVNKKFKETNSKNAKERKERQQKILDLMELIKTDILTDDNEEIEELYHSVEISEEILFEKVDDHFKIRPVFVPFLKLLDLSNISFNGTDIRYIDFRGTNAKMSINKVYNKDASYAKFDNKNLYDWKDYAGVRLIGTEMDEDPKTMINRHLAITDENTKLSSHVREVTMKM